MNKLEIQPEVFQRIPSLIVITGFVEIGSPNVSAVADYLNASWANLANGVKQHGYKNHPMVLQWRDALTKANVPINNFPPSIEAIAKRTEKVDKPFSINPIVDTYNAISMDLALPFGAYDADQLNGNLKLRVSPGGENFFGLGAKEQEQTLSSEIVYSDDDTILTRHFLWRQSDKGKILDSTKNIVFVCELLEEMGEETLNKAVSLIKDKFKELLSADIKEINILKKN